MKKKVKVSKKLSGIIAICLAIGLILPSIFVITNFESRIGQDAFSKLPDNEKVIVDDLAKRTNLSREEVIKLKSSGKTWNDIIDQFDHSQDASKQTAKSDGGNEEYIKKLKSDGYSDKEINDAKALVDRIMFDLKDITEDSNGEDKPSPVNPDNKTDNDLTAYKEIMEKLNTKAAVTLILKLKKEFSSQEKVLDEYLLSLQIGVDLELCLKDKKAYEKEKSEKMSSLTSNKIIDIDAIEAKLREKLQKANDSNKDKSIGNVQKAVDPVSPVTGTGGNNDSGIPRGKNTDEINPKASIPGVDGNSGDGNNPVIQNKR